MKEGVKSRRLVRVVVTLIVLVGLYWYTVRQWDEVLLASQQIDWSAIYKIGLFSLATLFVHALFLKYALMAIDSPIPWTAWLPITVVTTFANLVTPFRGGTIARAAYFKVRYELPVSKFVGVLSGFYLIYTAFHGVLGLLGVMLGSRIEYLGTLGFFFLSVVICPLILIWLSLRLPPEAVPTAFLRRTVAAASALVRVRKVHLPIGVLCIVYLFLFTLQMGVCLEAVGVQVSLFDLFVFSAVQGLSTLLTITPGALGVMEASAVFVGSYVGVSEAQALVMQFVFRLAFYLSVLVVFVPAVFFLQVDLGRNRERKGLGK